jgi:hypothetical protein
MIAIGVEGLFYPTVENEPGRRRSVPSVYEGKIGGRGVVDNRALVWYLPSFRRQGCFGAESNGPPMVIYRDICFFILFCS